MSSPLINCLIVDDEQHSIDVLTHHIAQSANLRLVGATTQTTEALTMINGGQVDLLFQDIHMPDISGLEFVHMLEKRCEVIFITAYKEYAVQGFELGVSDYLLKPISLPRSLVAVQRVIDKRKKDPGGVSPGQNDEGFFYVKTGVKGSVIKIAFADIEYAECLKNYTAIYHRGIKTLVYLSMKELEAALPKDQFVRVHKSYIVPLRRILRIEGGEIILSDNKTRISIGDTYKHAFWNGVRNKTLG